jgi:DNA-binding response OmpR family regulator
MSNKKILIVEDDADVRKGMHLRLQANNYDTFFAVDAVSGVAEARKHKPDLILLDLGLPGGDGFKVMEWLAANPYLAVIPVVVVSARTGNANRLKAKKAGAKAFLEKPVENDELLAVVRKTLGEAPKPKKALVHDLGDL